MYDIDEEYASGVLIYVTSKACADCPLASGKYPAVSAELAAYVERGCHRTGTMECAVVTIGERLGRPIPAYSVCYAFFYLYAHENVVLKRAVEEGRIRYLDVSDWPTLKDTHFHFYGPSYLETRGYRRNVYANPTVHKEIEE